MATHDTFSSETCEHCDAPLRFTGTTELTYPLNDLPLETGRVQTGEREYDTWACSASCEDHEPLYVGQDDSLWHEDNILDGDDLIVVEGPDPDEWYDRMREEW